MTRPLREVAPGLPHHIIHRGNNRRRIVSYATDYWRLLDFIADASNRWRCPIHALALMSNHLHLVVTPPDREALPRFVKSFAERYASYRNRRRRGTGKLFEDRYRSFILRDDEAVAAATTYIELNPVRARMVVFAEEHRWTTAGLHLGGARPQDWPPTLWAPSGWYLGLANSVADRAVAYRQWLAAPRAPRYEEELRDIEDLSSLHYGLRLERPDGSRAAEPAPRCYRAESRRVQSCLQGEEEAAAREALENGGEERSRFRGVFESLIVMGQE